MSKQGSAALHGASTAADAYVPTHGNGGYRVSFYDLELTYRAAGNQLTGSARISGTATQPLSRLSFDLATLRVGKVAVNGAPAARYSQDARKLHIWPAQSLPADAEFDVTISYAGRPVPIGGPWGALGWEELTDGVIVASQPNGAPSWFPCNDHPSSKAAYRVGVTTDSAYQVLANGVLTEKRRAASRTTWVYEQQEPMASYLATIQIGRYDLVPLGSGPVKAMAAVPPRRRGAFTTTFRRQAEMVDLFSRLFGPFPFAQYTVVITDDPLEIPLEAQGISVFGSNFLEGKRGQERLVAHELAHQWFGNSLTIDAWQHIWLHEGFACYAEWLWAEHSGGPTADRSAAGALATVRAVPQDLAIGDPGPVRMFDNRVYLRGALTVHALRKRLGDTVFFELIQEWTAQNRYGSVNTEKFLDLVDQRGGDVAQLRRWLFETALPT